MASSMSDSGSSVKQRTGSQFQVHFNNLKKHSEGTASSSSSVSPTPPLPPKRTRLISTRERRQAVFNSRALLAQKIFRAKTSSTWRRAILWLMTVLSMVAAWAVGYYQVHFAVLIVLLAVMAILWRDQGGKIVETIEQQVEMRLKRRKAVQPTETVEWISIALNRWWSVCNDSMVDLLKDYIEPLMEELAPAGVESIELLDIDLASETPTVSNMHIFDPPSSAYNYNSSVWEGLSNTGSEVSSKRTLIVNFDLCISSPHSRIVIRARLGSKKFGYSTLVHVEGLHVSGSIQAAVLIDRDAPFPHVASINATFVRRPDVWFSVKVLKGLKVTEIPVLKNWIHSFVMDMFTTLLVDPGKLTFNFVSTGIMGPMGVANSDSTYMKRAQGVVTVAVFGTPPSHSSEHEGDPRRWFSLRLGVQKHQRQLPLGKGVWQVTYSFLVYNINEDVLIAKVKLRRVVSRQTLAIHSLPLSSLQLVNELGEGVKVQRSTSVSNPEANLSLNIRYTPLPKFSLNIRNQFEISQVAGVLYVHIHSAADLVSADSDGFSDPYCIVLANKKKVLTTPYILDSLNPNWEKGVEFFVTDFTQVTLTFVVYDWDGPLVGDDLLGVAKLTLSQDRFEILQEKLELNIDGVTLRDGQTMGYITVSVIFRPVDSVAQTLLEPTHTIPSLEITDEVGVINEDPAVVGGAAAKLDLKHTLWEGSKQQAKKMAKLLKSKKAQYQRESHSSSGSGVLELSVLQGRNLVAKDTNGYSDPYVVVKYGSDTMYKSQVIKKSLDPEWDETLVLCAPSPDEIIKVECWDKDRFSDDFMGSLQFTEQDFSQFQDGPKWCRLHHVKTGELLLCLRRVSGHTETPDPQWTLTPSTQNNDKWLDLDEASRPLVGEVPLVDDKQVRGTIVRRGSTSTTSSVFSPDYNQPDADSHSDNGSVNIPPSSSASGSVHSFSPTGKSLVSLTTGGEASPASNLKRRNTLSYHPEHPLRTSVPARSYDDTTDPAHRPRYPETKADIVRALKGVNDSATLTGTSKRSTMERTRGKLPTTYHNIAGQVISADGLKGDLDHLELYIKVRLNSRPSYQRQHKFGRGPVVHKTRVLRGSSSPQWKEDFMVKESPVPSDSLLTVDLKSGSKINIGTYAITLDKFFEGSLKATKLLDIGNDVKLRIRLSRQPTPQPSPSLLHHSSRRTSKYTNI